MQPHHKQKDLPRISQSDTPTMAKAYVPAPFRSPFDDAVDMSTYRPNTETKGGSMIGPPPVQPIPSLPSNAIVKQNAQQNDRAIAETHSASSRPSQAPNSGLLRQRVISHDAGCPASRAHAVQAQVKVTFATPTDQRAAKEARPYQQNKVYSASSRSLPTDVLSTKHEPFLHRKLALDRLEGRHVKTDQDQDQRPSTSPSDSASVYSFPLKRAAESTYSLSIKQSKNYAASTHSVAFSSLDNTSINASKPTLDRLTSDSSSTNSHSKPVKQKNKILKLLIGEPKRKDEKSNSPRASPSSTSTDSGIQSLSCESNESSPSLYLSDGASVLTSSQSVAHSASLSFASHTGWAASSLNVDINVGKKEAKQAKESRKRAEKGIKDLEKQLAKEERQLEKRVAKEEKAVKDAKRKADKEAKELEEHLAKEERIAERRAEKEEKEIWKRQVEDEKRAKEEAKQREKLRAKEEKKAKEDAQKEQERRDKEAEREEKARLKAMKEKAKAHEKATEKALCNLGKGKLMDLEFLKDDLDEPTVLEVTKQIREIELRIHEKRLKLKHLDKSKYGSKTERIIRRGIKKILPKKDRRKQESDTFSTPAGESSVESTPTHHLPTLSNDDLSKIDANFATVPEYLAKSFLQAPSVPPAPPPPTPPQKKLHPGTPMARHLPQFPEGRPLSAIPDVPAEMEAERSLDELPLILEEHGTEDGSLEDVDDGEDSVYLDDDEFSDHDAVEEAIREVEADLACLEGEKRRKSMLLDGLVRDAMEKPGVSTDNMDVLEQLKVIANGGMLPTRHNENSSETKVELEKQTPQQGPPEATGDHNSGPGIKSIKRQPSRRIYTVTNPDPLSDSD